MAVGSGVPYNVHTGNGVATSYAYGFTVLAAADLVATVAGVTTSVTVNNVGNASGGTVTFSTPPANGAEVILRRVLTLTRLIEYQTNGDWLATTVNADFDRLLLQIQGVSAVQDRSLRAPFPETLDDLPDADSRANKLASWDADGQPSATAPTDGTATAFAIDLADTAASGNGDALVGVKNTATGGSSRTQHARNQEDMRSTDFASLQEAVTAAAGKVLRVIGSYSLASTTITVPADTWIDCREASLTWSGNVTGLAFTSGGGITGGTLTGAGNTSYNDSGRAIACFGTNNSPSAPTFVNAPTIRDVTITEWAGYGVFLGYTNGGSVENCNIAECGYAGVAGVSCNDLLVHGNRINGVAPGSGGGDAYGIFVDRNDQASETAYPRSYRVRILGNDVRNVAAATGNNGQGIDTHAGVDFVIAGNHVEGCEVGIFVTASPSGTQAFAPKGCVVEGNTIRDTLRVGYGIQVSGAINGSTVAEYAEGIVVRGNTIFGHGIAADGTSGAIRTQVTRGLVIEGNTIRSPACNGIVFNTENISFHAAANTIIDPFDSTHTTPACYFVDSNNNSGVIASGSLYYQNSGLGTYVATNSYRTDSSLSGIDIGFGRHIFVNVDSTHLSVNLGTTAGSEMAGFYTESGSTSLSAGSVNISFNKRFPSTPKVFVFGTSDANAMRASAISTTATTITGTGTTAFSWMATT